ncbi:hypothetical protein BDK88_1197 [Natrinema hispanicum]|uniref:Uncharacterized protein n=1 Tax=Natrinema hispanicum TaxID=392421 RepID=A0A482YEJ4_9EURY|nr:hypothetical protein [Natrinema hispanicum]RZV12295.1 hypothetical protein BDK88_1197 [Natrinema hispanicum]
MTTDESADDRPDLTESLWNELLEDTRAVADEYREDGWDVVVLEPTDIAPVDSKERVGLDVTVSADEYDVVGGLIEGGNVTITAADVYYRPLAEAEIDQRVALAVERDDDSETAIFVPLAYDITAVRPVFETALLEEQLLVHVMADPDDGWVSFSHDDPSLFLEESDVRAWDEE